MQAKNKRAPTALERRWIEMLAAQPCAVCGDTGPVEVHEFEQGNWFAAVPLCAADHRGPAGWHGTRDRWSLHRMTAERAIGLAVRRNFERLERCQ